MKAKRSGNGFRTFSSIVAVALLPVSAQAANLTGIMLFSCDADGNPAGNFVWDTRGFDSDFYKLWLTRGVAGGSPEVCRARSSMGRDGARRQ